MVIWLSFGFVGLIGVLVYFFEKEKRWLWYQIIELRHQVNGTQRVECLNQPGQTVVPGALSQISDTPSRILLLKLDHIGDMVLTIPALRAIRARFPLAEITLACGSWGVDLLQNEGLVNHFISNNYSAPGSTINSQKAELRRFKEAVQGIHYDIAVDLRPFGDTQFILNDVSADFKLGGYPEKASRVRMDFLDIPVQDIHAIQKISRLAQHLGATLATPYPYVTLTADECHYATEFFEKHQLMGQVVVGIHPFAGVPTKEWAPHNFAQVATQLVAQYGYKVLWFAVRQNETFASLLPESIRPMVTVITDTRLRESLALMARCTVFVSNDSGPMHMASAAGCPTLGVFSGVAIPLEWGPYGVNNRTIMADIGCIRCQKSSCSHNSCLTSIQPAAVVSEIMEMIAARSVRVQ